MKKFYVLLISAFALINVTNAQVIFEESFNYPAGSNLITDAVASTAVTDGVTGWTTQKNAASATNAFTVTAASLNYPGLVPSTGNALKFADLAGQSVFKAGTETIKDFGQTFYYSFLINVEDVSADGSDYFMTIRMDLNASNSNFASRLFAMVDNGEVTFGISKANNTASEWTENTCKTGETHFLVIKYEIGKDNGGSSAAEAGKYDDKMTLYVNPTLSAEPTTGTISYASETDRDLLRWGASKVFGGYEGFHLKSPGDGGKAPVYTIDEIKLGRTWADVVSATTGIFSPKNNEIKHSLNGKMLSIDNSNNLYTQYQVLNLSGQVLLKGQLQAEGNQIALDNLQQGVYLISAQGKETGTAKILVK